MKKLAPLPRRHVQEFAYQLLQGVACKYRFTILLDLYSLCRFRAQIYTLSVLFMPI